MKDRIRQIIVDALRLEDLRPEDLKDHANLVEELDIDSIDILEIAMSLEDAFEVRMPDDQPEIYTSVHTLVEFLEGAK